VDRTGKTLRGLLVGVVLGGILLFAFLAYQFRTQSIDLTNAPQFHGWQGRCVELIQNAFVVRNAGGTEILILCPRDFYYPSSIPHNPYPPRNEYFDVPVSVSDYRSHLHDWNHSPEFVEKWGAPNPRPAAVLAVLEKGTRLKVIRLVKTGNPDAGYDFQIFVTGPGEFVDKSLDARYLFGIGEDKRLRPCSP
jgi:hypothetical protein